MQIHPDIAALRSDPASQRHAQAPVSRAAKRWHASAQVEAIAANIAGYAEGAVIDECSQLNRLLNDFEFAQEFVAGWCRTLIRPLSEQPLGQVPSRHSAASGLSTMQLMSAGNVTLSLLAYEERADVVEPSSVLFADRDVSEIVLAGEAHGLAHRITGLENGCAQIDTAKVIYAPGSRMVMHAGAQNRQIVSVEGAMLVLQLIRSPDRPSPTREYSLEDGRLLHQASGNKRASQHFLALDVLGAMERHDAVSAMVELALSVDDEADLRWEAVRQTLALDTAAGLSLLRELSRRDTDLLSAPAASLQQSLIAANAQLAQLSKEVATCPA